MSPIWIVVIVMTASGALGGLMSHLLSAQGKPAEVPLWHSLIIGGRGVHNSAFSEHYLGEFDIGYTLGWKGRILKNTDPPRILYPSSCCI